METENARLYKDNCDMYTKDGIEFLELAVKVLEWSSYDMEGKVVMDIGCGPATYSKDFMFKNFPTILKFIGIDRCNCMITQAISDTPMTMEAEFMIFDIENDPVPREYIGKVDKIVSQFCLNWIKDQYKVFQRISGILKPGGEAAIVFFTYSKYWSCLYEIRSFSKWRNILMDIDPCVPKSHLERFDAVHYQRILEDIGFEVVMCEKLQKSYQFPSEEAAKGFVVTICPFLEYIPESEREEFKEEFFKVCHKCINSSLVFKYEHMRVMFRKPHIRRSTTPSLF